LAAQLRQLEKSCAVAGLDVDVKVVKHIRKRPSLIDRLKLCADDDDYLSLYHAAESAFGTATKKAIVAVDTKMRIAINGDFTVPQESSSKFYIAYADGVPCVLKFPESAAVALQEAQVYNAAVQHAPAGAQHLVRVEYLRFDSQLTKLPRQHALKMEIFVSTLQTCPQDARLDAMWARAAEATFAALQSLHTAGFMHCDVKPGNIFVAPSGACFLGDYDAAVAEDARVLRTTEAFLPDELKALQHARSQVGDKLRASRALDFGMLACTLAYLMKPESISAAQLTLGGLEAFARKVATSAASASSAASAAPFAVPSAATAGVAAVMLQCIQAMQADQQIAEGAALLAQQAQQRAEAAQRQQQQHSSGPHIPEDFTVP
jgi:hypothetical protein